MAVLMCSCEVAVTPTLFFLRDWLFSCVFGTCQWSPRLCMVIARECRRLYDFGEGIRSRLQFHHYSLNEVWLSASSSFISHFDFTASFDCFPWIQCSTCSWGGNRKCSIVVQLLSRVQLSATPWTTAYQASLSSTVSWSLLKLMSIESVMPSSHLIICHSLLLLPSVFPSIRVFSSESALHIRWPKYWSFNFSINPSNE